MSAKVSGEEDGVVREPESVEECLERNCCEESSGKVWNWEGRIKGEPKQLLLEIGLRGHWDGSVGQEEPRELGNQVMGSTTGCEGGFDSAVTRSIIPFDCGWKAVVWMWEICRRENKEF